MTMKDRIAIRLHAAFNPNVLHVIDESSAHAGHSGAKAGGESHFRIQIESQTFTGKTRIAIHKMIYASLEEEMTCEGGIHALAIEARGV
jgi:BolA protein